MYRQPPNCPYDLALALAQVANDEAARKQLAAMHVSASIVQFALSWERQVAVQRRVDGYLLSSSAALTRAPRSPSVDGHAQFAVAIPAQARIPASPGSRKRQRHR
ncbi:MAG: hypothetical protein ACRDP7_12630 [Trebonia sp.]